MLLKQDLGYKYIIMKIAELLRTIADIVDSEQPDQQNTLSSDVVSITDVTPEQEQSQLDLAEIMKLAGVAKATTEPDIHIFPLSSAFPAGDDFHYSKNPADMRSDSVSLYPAYTAQPKE